MKTVLRNYIYDIKNDLYLTNHNGPIFISELKDSFESIGLN
jgi:hypothetical protein